MPKKQAAKDIAEQFSNDEMEAVKAHGQALGGAPTSFDEEVEKHLADHYPHEISYSKMRAAQTGGYGLGPPEMDITQAKQTTALQQEAAAQGAQQAQRAQAAQVQAPPPAAPSGPVGVSEPYPATASEEPSAPQQPPQGSQVPGA
jgi:hypothetical protein